MADVTEDIAAAAAQAVASSMVSSVVSSVTPSASAVATVGNPSASPPIKYELEPPPDDAPMRDPEPAQEPLHPPIKRSRSQSAHDENDMDSHNRDEKRLKIESVEDYNDNIVDIASLVQQAEASVMQELMPEPELETEPKSLSETMPDPENHDIPQDILDIINRAQAKLDSNGTGNDNNNNSAYGSYGDIGNDISQDILDAINQTQVKPDDDDDGISQDILDAINEAANHECLNQQTEPQAEDEKDLPDTIWGSPNYYTRRKHIIPALGNLAVDILIAWSEQSLEDTMAVLGVGNDPDSEVAKEYAVLKSTFDAQRRLLSEDGPLLDTHKFYLTKPGREVIRIVNLATLCASIFGTNEIGWEELNEQFLAVFVAETQPLSQDTAELFLSLKTQIYLASLESEPSKPKAEVLNGLFTKGLREKLQAHHPDMPLDGTEIQFIASAAARRAMLLDESTDSDNIEVLSRQFSYEAFLDSLNTYLNDNIEYLTKLGTATIEMELPPESDESSVAKDLGIEGLFDLDAVIAEASKAAQSAVEPAGEGTSANHDDLTAFLAENISKAAEQAKKSSCGMELPSAIASAAESASRATMLALQSIQQNKYHPTAPPQSTTQTNGPSSHAHYHSPHAQPQARYYQNNQHLSNNFHHAYQTTSDALPPNQSDTTPVLYEKARQAAAARSSTHARREGTHSTRRPWSPEEEKALMMGLDMVKGPHWSQILGLFGPNGSISNILADRTQVQLKDKARNLKLFFLKTNSEMPYYLHCVTGELKTRAPTQAARKEAEEKAKTEEQQAHVNGVMTLANGLQSHAQKTAPSAAANRPGMPGQALASPNPMLRAPKPAQLPLQKPGHFPMSGPRPAIPAAQPVYLPLPPKPQATPQLPQPSQPRPQQPQPPPQLQPPLPRQPQQQPQPKPQQQSQQQHTPQQAQLPQQQQQQQLPQQQQQQQLPQQAQQAQQTQQTQKHSQQPPSSHPNAQQQTHPQIPQQNGSSHQPQELQKSQSNIKLPSPAQPQPHPRYSEQLQSNNQQPQQLPTQSNQAQNVPASQPPSQPQRTERTPPAENSIESAIEEAVGACLKQEESGLSREEDALFDLKAAIERETANALASTNGTPG